MKTSSYDEFLAGLLSRSAKNDRAGHGAAIERYRGAPNEGRKTACPQHVLTMCSSFPARFEGKSAPFVKVPGTLSLVPAGVAPAWSARTDFELTVCAMDVSLVNEVHAELNTRPEAELRYRRNFEDAATQQLMQLFFADSEDGYSSDSLYVDHLISALVCRFLVVGREGDLPNTAKQVSPLPRHILRRVIDRMRNLDSKSNLQMLAKESGYSRVHFLRMFRAATGYAPHNYLLKLRVDRVRELLASSTLSLTDIALECGFSSHSHLTRVFRQVLGSTPSAYRRSL